MLGRLPFISQFRLITPPVMHTHSVRALELKIPPVALVIAAAILMWLGSAYVSVLSFQFSFRSTVAWVFGLLGLITCTLGVVQFRQAKTMVNPTKPESSSSLVTSGIYRHTRNPMYLGFLLILISWAPAMANLVAFVVLPGFLIYMNRFQIKPEERALTLIFGADFKVYCVEAPRWI
jgi:protein-S-isoprenylcysteine O-methyltransferase Ste14